MSNIVAFPARPAVLPRPAWIADLPAGAEAIVISRDQGGFALSLRQPERKVQTWFADRSQALRQARSVAMRFPTIYRLIVDETGVGGVA